MVQPVENESYSFADYLNREEQDRIEIINGNVIKMLTPPTVHQAVSGEMTRQIADFLLGKQYKLYFRLCVRPFERDGELPEQVDTVVEPDIIVVCDHSKLDDYGCKGAPDMVIEILSPSTLRHDRIVKLDLYQRAGVREYWIADPQSRSIEVYLLDENNYLKPREVYTAKDTAKVTVLDGCTVELERVFPEAQ